MSLDTIVNISITVQSRAPSERDTGTPLLFGYHTAWLGNRVREYSQAADLLDDGFTTNDDLYKAALIVKSQNPSPAVFKIGRRATPLTQIVDLTPTVTTEGFEYKGQIGGKVFSYVVGAAATLASVCTAMAAAIDALVTGTDASGVSGTKVVCTSLTPGKIIEFDFTSMQSTHLKVKDVTVDTTTDDELALVLAEDADWYGLTVIDSFSKATGLNVAAVIESIRKEAVVQTSDDEVHDVAVTDDIMSAIKTAAYGRTGVIFSRCVGGTNWLGAGWLAGQLAYEPGSATPAFKEVKGVKTSKLTQGQIAVIESKNGSYYSTVGGVGMTFEGKSGSGEFLDTTRFVDWQFFDMQDALFGALLNNPKIPYTDTGVDVIRSIITASLLRGVAAGGLAAEPAPTVTAPKVADVAAGDRIARKLPDVKFEATLAGAIHRLVIKGTIAV